jgi:hypothetical protein
MSAFISRLWGFRHVNFAIENKPFVLVICGIGHRKDTAEEDFRKALSPFEVRILDVVKYYSKLPPCYKCGRHQECSIGGAYKMWGDKAHTLTITPELFTKWEDDASVVKKVTAVAEKLRKIVVTST